MERRKGYRNRLEAGEVLATELIEYKGMNPLVLAVPRGGVPVALPVVKMLSCELDLTIPRKIGAPFQPEIAIGAVCEDGEVLLNTYMTDRLGVDDSYIKKAAADEVSEIKRRLFEYRGERAPVDAAGRTVIVIDDGVATGFTITAALKAVRRNKPRELVLAVPVGAPDSIEALAREADKVVCPFQPEPFYAVGQFYGQFEQLSDSDVRAMLRQVWEKTL